MAGTKGGVLRHKKSDPEAAFEYKEVNCDIRKGMKKARKLHRGLMPDRRKGN